jgi:Zn-dependent M28 family amino/carboxypeptidase
VGCGEGLVRQAVVGAKLPNLICTLRGRTPARIVVGANYDRPGGGRGIVDDWTGAAMLPSLFTAMLAERREHTFEFVAFFDAAGWREPTAKETWNLGSEYYVRSLDRPGRARIRAMVGLLALGLGPTSAWAAHADPNLWLDLGAVTRALGLPLRDVSFAGGVPSDAEPFRTWGLPSITLHSHDQDSLALLRDATRDKSLARVDADRYVESFRLVAVYLAYLDQSLAARTAPAAAGTERGD